MARKGFWVRAGSSLHTQPNSVSKKDHQSMARKVTMLFMVLGDRRRQEVRRKSSGEAEFLRTDF